ncbi:MAG TPA: hypothetical protein VGM17_10970 [Rhizomicrobium sp.]
MSGQQALSDVIGVLVVVYNGTIFGFMLYLKRSHRPLWDSFGGHGFFNTDGPFDTVRFVRTGLYALFQGGHWSLRDQRATIFVFAIRGLLLICVVLIALYIWSG